MIEVKRQKSIETDLLPCVSEIWLNLTWWFLFRQQLMTNPPYKCCSLQKGPQNYHLATFTKVYSTFMLHSEVEYQYDNIKTNRDKLREDTGRAQGKSMF